MGEALGLLLMLLSAGTRKSSPETALAHDLLLNTIVLFVSPVGGASLSPEEANDADVVLAASESCACFKRAKTGANKKSAVHCII